VVEARASRIKTQPQRSNLMFLGDRSAFIGTHNEIVSPYYLLKWKSCLTFPATKTMGYASRIKMSISIKISCSFITHLQQTHNTLRRGAPLPIATFILRFRKTKVNQSGQGLIQVLYIRWIWNVVARAVFLRLTLAPAAHLPRAHTVLASCARECRGVQVSNLLLNGCFLSTTESRLTGDCFGSQQHN
jgi:hypothetical protein